MKNQSSIFDSIRVKPEQDRRVKDKGPQCQWDGCPNAGTNKAPMGRGQEGNFFLFCIEHVREYNKSYNYFTGMTDDAVAKYHKDSLTGHRPTWKMGVNGSPDEEDEAIYNAKKEWTEKPKDPFELFSKDGKDKKPSKTPKRRIRSLEKKAFDTLDMDETTDAEKIKTRYKELVKRHHPDANGGDRSSEERLRQIIQAYNVLKQAGFC